MFEVEQKFRIADRAALVAVLESFAAKSMVTQAKPAESHCDSYFNHPCRDFAETKEALRIRRVDGVPLVTYKGMKLPGLIKAREEMEWPLGPGDEDGTKMESLLIALGFVAVRSVRKSRVTYTLTEPYADLTVVIDDVEGLGPYAEIEAIVADKDGVEAARDQIGELAHAMGLNQPEPRSYLRMVIESETDG